MRRVLFILAVTLLVPALWVWSGGKGEAKPKAVTYSLWVGEGTWLTSIMDLSFQDPVAKEITKRTGVTLQLSAARTDNPAEELNVMLASGELPDMVSISGSAITKLIAGKYVIPLDDLIDKYAPDLKRNLGHVFNYWRYDDGNIYRVRGWVWNNPRYSLSFDVNTLYMRYDILKELGYAKLARTNPKDSVITIDEYVKLLNDVRQKHPDMVPVLMNGDFAFQVMVLSTGVDSIAGAVWEDGKGKTIYDSKDAAWAIKWLNKLYLDGYMDKGFATMDKEQFQALTASGKVFSALGRFEGLPEARSALTSENEEKRLVMFYLVKDASVKHVGINGYYIDGSNSLFITSKAKDPVGIMKFFNWSASDEGSLLCNGGIEGLTFTVDAKGKRHAFPEALKAYTDWDSVGMKKFGLGAWEVLPGLAGFDKNGEAYDVCQQDIFQSNKWGQYDMFDWKFFANPVYTQDKIGNIDSEKQKDAYDANSKIGAYIRDRIAKAIASPNAAASEAEWKATYDMMKADGISALDAAKNEKDRKSVV